MGPCKITPQAPPGVCGADADLIVSRNLLRSAAAGVAQHGAHAREVILSLKFVAEGRLNLPIIGVEKLHQVSKPSVFLTTQMMLKPWPANWLMYS